MLQEKVDFDSRRVASAQRMRMRMRMLMLMLPDRPNSVRQKKE